jgi:disulfide bond formation protein DsbB
LYKSFNALNYSFSLRVVIYLTNHFNKIIIRIFIIIVMIIIFTFESPLAIRQCGVEKSDGASLMVMSALSLMASPSSSEFELASLVLVFLGLFLHLYAALRHLGALGDPRTLEHSLELSSPAGSLPGGKI